MEKYCYACSNVIYGTYQIRRYVNKEYFLCRQCSQGNRCEACDRPESRINKIRLRAINRGFAGKVRHQCEECNADAIDSVEDAKNILLKCFESSE